MSENKPEQERASVFYAIVTKPRKPITRFETIALVVFVLVVVAVSVVNASRDSGLDGGPVVVVVCGAHGYGGCHSGDRIGGHDGE